QLGHAQAQGPALGLDPGDLLLVKGGAVPGAEDERARLAELTIFLLAFAEILLEHVARLGNQLQGLLADIAITDVEEVLVAFNDGGEDFAAVLGDRPAAGEVENIRRAARATAEVSAHCNRRENDAARIAHALKRLQRPQVALFHRLLDDVR